MPRQSPYQIVLSLYEREALERLARQYTAPYCDVIRAKAILMAADGAENKDIAEKLDLPRQIVSKWRQRFHDQRMPGLENLPRR